MGKKLLTRNAEKSRGKLIDETGNRYNGLHVIEYAGAGKDLVGNDCGAMWLCKCDCGNVIHAKGTKLRRGIQKSCGCFWKKPKGEGSFNAMYSVRKYNAKLRGIKWNLSKDQVKKIAESSCVYCGLPPSNVSRGSANGDYIYTGIDRIDSDGGYEIDNIVPCCNDCNKAKLTMSVVEFTEWIKRLVVHNGWECDLDTIKFKNNKKGE